jgi:uncharacterized protein involved in high-affinity Fe2+ transport
MTEDVKRTLIVDKSDYGTVVGIGIRTETPSGQYREAIHFNEPEVEKLRRHLNKQRHKRIAFSLRRYAEQK